MLKNKLTRLVLFLLGAVLTLGACAPGTGTAPNELTGEKVETSMPELDDPEFRIIGYVTQATIAEDIPYADITHINYAFLIPNADGSFKFLPNAWKLHKIVELAHQNDVEVLISVGGWGWDAEFESLAENDETRATFITELAAFADEFQLDGVDIDWEYPDTGESAENYLLLIQELRAAMPNKLITAAVVAQGETGNGILTETFDIFDFLNIMVYDGGRPHSTYEMAESAIAYWQARGLAKEKTVLGVPFYAHPSHVPYRKIVEAQPEAANFDVYEYQGVSHDYNGIPTMQQKTLLAQEQGSGIMIWTLEFDARDDLSLLHAIHKALVGNIQD